ncbi:hypothetical protein ACSVC9_10260 [Clostridium sp. LBM24168]
MSFKDKIKSWLFEVVKMYGNIKPTTFARYEGLYRNIIINYLSRIKSVNNP